MKPKNQKKNTFLASQSTAQTFLRNNRRGITIYMHTSISYRVMKVKYEVLFEEACLIEIQLEKGDKLIIGCFYRSPTQVRKIDGEL